MSRRSVSLVPLSMLAATLPASAAEFAGPESMAMLQRTGEYRLTDEQWRAKLSAGQYSILRNASTERPFTSPLNNEKRAGAC